MNTRIITSLAALAIAGSASTHAATVSLVNSNTEQVTEGGNDFTSEILAGQTLYVGLPYNGAGAWPSAEATDLLEVSTFLLGIGGTSTVSFSFYSATDTGTELSAITELSGFTAGSVSVSAAANGLPASDPANTSVAGVTAQVQYADLTGNPFSSISNGIVWLGITNTGSNTVAYYLGSPSGFPAPVFHEFAGPFDSGVTSLHEDTYVYNSSGVLPEGGANQNVHPYLTITAETIPVPEPGPAALAGLAGVMLLFRRRI